MSTSNSIKDLFKYATTQRNLVSNQLDRERAVSPSRGYTRINSPDALYSLLSHLDPKIALAAAWMFHTISHADVSESLLSRLLTLLDGDRPSQRIATAFALGDLGTAAARTETCDALLDVAIDDPVPDAQAAAVYALGRLAPPVIAALGGRAEADTLFNRVCTVYDEACHSPTPLLRRAAVNAIAQLGHDHLPSRLCKAVEHLVLDANPQVQSAARRVHSTTLTWALPPTHVGSRDHCPNTFRENAAWAARAEHMRRLSELIRVGTDQPSSIEIWRRAVADAFASIQESAGETQTWTLAERLELATWQAEYHDRQGGHVRARKTLEEAVDFPLADAPHEYLPKLMQAGIDQRTLKKAFWLVMLYAWIRFYRTGAYLDSRNVLRSLWKGTKALRTSDDPWHGTRCRWRYYYAHCLRGLRRFRRAETFFAAALVNARDHVRFRGTRQPLSRFDSQWATVTAARIQGTGSGWVLLQEGRLRDARRMLLQAGLQLEATGEESLKLFNRSLEAFTRRRQLTPLRHEASYYAQAMSELRECAAAYHRLGDVAGELRCQQELCRGFLDLAEFSEDGRSREEALHVLDIMRELRGLVADKRWELRCDVLWGRYVLTPLTSRQERPNPSSDLEELAAKINWHREREPSNGDLLVMQALIAWVYGREEESGEMFQIAIDEASVHDPVLNREAALLQAWCTATSIRADKRGNRDRARILKEVFVESCLRPIDRLPLNWTRFRPADVDNGYLRILAQRVEYLVTDLDNDVFKVMEKIAAFPPPPPRINLVAGHARQWRAMGLD